MQEMKVIPLIWALVINSKHRVQSVSWIFSLNLEINQTFSVITQNANFLNATFSWTRLTSLCIQYFPSYISKWTLEVYSLKYVMLFLFYYSSKKFKEVKNKWTCCMHSTLVGLRFVMVFSIWIIFKIINTNRLYWLLT